MKVWIGRWAPAVFIMALIFIASATPGSELPDYGSWDTFFKKGGHALGYAMLTTAYYHALNKGRNNTRFRFATAAVVLSMLYAVTDEWHQKFTPGRTASPWDVCIDVAGGILGLTLWCLIRRRLQGSKRQKQATDQHG